MLLFGDVVGQVASYYVSLGLPQGTRQRGAIIGLQMIFSSGALVLGQPYVLGEPY